MHTMNFLSLPVELLHKILGHLDLKDILSSFRCVCKQFHAAIVTYNKFELDFTSISTSHLELVSYIIQPENIISLTISNNFEGKLSKFFSLYNIRRFTRLHSLTLDQINHVDLDRFLQHINISTLMSLSINSSESNKTKASGTISSAINRSHLKNLYLYKFDNIIQSISWPVQYTLQHLTIGLCTYEELHLILGHSPHLHTLVLKKCYMYSLNGSNVVPFIDVRHPQLTSLTMEDCPCNAEELKIILSLTPSLVYLKLSSSGHASSFLFDGTFWVELIQSKLPLLDRFDFMFYIPSFLYFDTYNPRLCTLSFQTPFWLTDKHWFVTCDCYLTGLYENRMVIYTSPIQIMKEPGIIIKYKTSAINDVRLLKKSIINGTIFTEDTLTTLNLDGKQITGRMAQYLGDALQNNIILNTLSLRGGHIEDNEIKCLSEALQKNTTLTSLYLENNRIGADGIKYLTDMFRNKPLRTLDLKHNNFKTEGLQFLADILQINTTLTTINLQNNSINATAIQHLTNALRNNRTLLNLYLGDNQIGDKGTQYLADMLKNNTTLITLDLKNNKITRRGAEHLVDALRNNTTLTTLSLERNAIPIELYHVIKSSLTLTTSHLKNYSI